MKTSKPSSTSPISRVPAQLIPPVRFLQNGAMVVAGGQNDPHATLKGSTDVDRLQSAIQQAGETGSQVVYLNIQTASSLLKLAIEAQELESMAQEIKSARPRQLAG